MRPTERTQKLGRRPKVLGTHERIDAWVSRRSRCDIHRRGCIWEASERMAPTQIITPMNPNNYPEDANIYPMDPNNYPH